METCWNVTIKDTSPLIKYFPYADGDTKGWTGVFREGNRVINGVTVGSGDSQHVTAGQAYAQIAFNGTAIYLNGAIMGSMQYQVELDGQVLNGQANGPVLASFTNLSGKQEHTLLLRSKPQASGDWLALQSAIITVGTGLTGASFASMTKTQDDPAWSYAPGYTLATNPVTNANTRQSLAAGDWAALTFSGHSVLVHGTRNTDHGRYSVTVDGHTQTFNSTSGVMINDAVLFLSSGMDSLQTHVVNITNLDSRVMDIGYAEIMTVQGGTAFDPQNANNGSTNAPSGLNLAVILGAAIGGLALLLVVFVFFWLRRRRNKKRTQTAEDTPSSPPSTGDSKTEMTMAAITPVGTQSSTRPRVRFGELARPGMEEPPTTGPNETPPSIRPMHSILRRQESNTSNAPLLAQASMDRPDDQVSLASTNNSGLDISNPSLSVAAPDSRRTSPAPSISAPVRPPRPPQGLFATSEIPKFPESEDAEQAFGFRVSGTTLVLPNPFEERESTGRSNTASPVPNNPGPLKLRTENISQPAPEQRSATQARKDLLVALESEQVTMLGRSGTRKVGLPSNPRAGLGLSRENSSKY